MSTSSQDKTEKLPNAPEANEVSESLPKTKKSAQQSGVGSKEKNVTDRVQGAEAAANTDNEEETEVTRESLQSNFYHDMIVADNLKASFGNREENDPMPEPLKRS